MGRGGGLYSTALGINGCCRVHVLKLDTRVVDNVTSVTLSTTNMTSLLKLLSRFVVFQYVESLVMYNISKWRGYDAFNVLCLERHGVFSPLSREGITNQNALLNILVI